MSLKDRITPALSLFFLAPAIGELLSGSSPPLEFFNPFSLFLLCLMYGCGALLVREAVFRWGKGWPSMLLLGAAYGIAEEGLACKSFFDSGWMDIGVLGSYGNWGGVNWIWTLELTAYHAVISISVPTILVTLLFPEKRNERWLSDRGLALSWAGFLFIIAFCYFLISAYRPPAHLFILAALTAVGLVLLAWKLPHPFPWPKFLKIGEATAPRSVRWFAAFGVCWTVGLFFFSWIAVGLGPAELTGTLMIVYFFVSGILLARATGGGRLLDDRRRGALASGALGFLIFIGIVLELGGIRGMSVVALATLILLWRFNKMLEARETISPGTTASLEPSP